MAFDEKLAERVRNELGELLGFSERKMFGGLCFLLDGHMCCGITGTNLMLRLGQAGATAALTEANVREMDFTGTPLASMVYVEPDGYAADADLVAWLDRAVGFVRTLPPKRPKAKRYSG